MRRKIQIRTATETDPITNIWIQHLINRIVIEQLNLPNRLKAKLLYESSLKHKRGV